MQALAGIATSIGLSIIKSLLTEAFAKRMIIRLLEAFDDDDKTDTYSRIIADLKETWGMS